MKLREPHYFETRYADLSPERQGVADRTTALYRARQAATIASGAGIEGCGIYNFENWQVRFDEKGVRTIYKKGDQESCFVVEDQVGPFRAIDQGRRASMRKSGAGDKGVNVYTTEDGSIAFDSKGSRIIPPYVR